MYITILSISQLTVFPLVTNGEMKCVCVMDMTNMR